MKNKFKAEYDKTTADLRIIGNGYTSPVILGVTPEGAARLVSKLNQFFEGSSYPSGTQINSIILAFSGADFKGGENE